MENATFYEHLMQLNHWDGLQLATAQMVISSSSANGNLAGGDLLRMAHGILKFRDLQTSPSIPIAQRENTHVLTLAMEDYLASPENVTANLIEFVLGSNDTVVPRDLRMDAARDYAARVAAAGRKKKPGTHVTQGKHEDREELRQALQDDAVLGPILREIEILVNAALVESEELVYP